MFSTEVTKSFISVLNTIYRSMKNLGFNADFLFTVNVYILVNN